MPFCKLYETKKFNCGTYFYLIKILRGAAQLEEFLNETIEHTLIVITLFTCQLFVDDSFPIKGGVAAFCAPRRITATTVRWTVAELPQLRELQGTNNDCSTILNLKQIKLKILKRNPFFS
jgi:hypothetical protein